MMEAQIRVGAASVLGVQLGAQTAQVLNSLEK